MKRMGWPRLISPSTALAFLALMVALGGSSYAVTRIAARSVGTTELKRQAVARANLKDNVVDGGKVQDDSLRGRDILESSLGQVPSAARAMHATTADRATDAFGAIHSLLAAGLDRIVYRLARSSVAQAATDPADPTVTIAASGTATAACDNGQFVVGGGVKVEDTNLQVVTQQFPDNGGRAWTASVANDDASEQHGFTVYAICVTADAAG